MTPKLLLAASALSLSLIASDALAQANHNTVRASKKRVADLDTDVTGNLDGHVVLVRMTELGAGVPPTPRAVATKALDGSGGVITHACGMIAAPQGFTIDIVTRDYDVNSSAGLKTAVSVNQITPWVIARTPGNVSPGAPGSATDPGPTTPLAHSMGNQTHQQGRHPDGGWAHAMDGTHILGPVWHIRANSPGQAYSGGFVSKEWDGDSTSVVGSMNCGQSTLNHAISQLNQAMGSSIPTISGASMAYNNRSPMGAPPDTSGTHTDWAGDLYEAYYAETGYPGWVFPEGGVSAPGGVGSVGNTASSDTDGVLAAPDMTATEEGEPAAAPPTRRIPAVTKQKTRR